MNFYVHIRSCLKSADIIFIVYTFAAGDHELLMLNHMQKFGFLPHYIVVNMSSTPV